MTRPRVTVHDPARLAGRPTTSRSRSIAATRRGAWPAASPAWLGADRRAALERFEALPVETNQLYTTYVDLRAAALEDARPYETVATDAGRPRRSRRTPTAFARRSTEDGS